MPLPRRINAGLDLQLSGSKLVRLYYRTHHRAVDGAIHVREVIFRPIYHRLVVERSRTANMEASLQVLGPRS